MADSQQYPATASSNAPQAPIPAATVAAGMSADDSRIPAIVMAESHAAVASAVTRNASPDDVRWAAKRAMRKAMYREMKQLAARQDGTWSALTGRADAPTVALLQHLASLPELQTPLCLAVYDANGWEHDLWPLIFGAQDAGVPVFLPRSATAPDASTDTYVMARITTFMQGLVVGRFGIREPASTERLATADELAGAVWLVPGVAFDRQGWRLGHGRGFYDRLLAHRPAIRMGVARAWQIVDAVPHDERFDIPMTHLVSENGVIPIVPSSSAPA